MKNTPTQKPFWEDMRNPITMYKVTRQTNQMQKLYNKNNYPKNT